MRVCVFAFLLILLFNYGCYAADGLDVGDQCYDHVHAGSYAYDEGTCSLSSIAILLGYVPTASMNPESSAGYFNPEITLQPGTVFDFSWLSFLGLGRYCSRPSSPTRISYLDMGGTMELKKDSNGINATPWIITKIGVANAHIRIEEIVPTRRPYTIDRNCAAKLPDKSDYDQHKGRFGPDFPGQLALCAYTTSFFWWAGSRNYDSVATDYNAVKCVKLPHAPPPPPFCDMIMSASKVSMVYLKPNLNTGVGTYFSPAVRLVYNKAIKTCTDGSVVDPSVKCSDGSVGASSARKDAATISVSMDSTGKFPSTVQKVNIGGMGYNISLTVSDTDICGRGGFNNQLENLGCLPRGGLTVPELVFSGQLGVISTQDSLAVQPKFLGAPSNPQSPLLLPTSAAQIADILTQVASSSGSPSSPNNPSSQKGVMLANYFGMQLSAARTAFKPRGDEVDFISPKRICAGSDGIHRVYDAAKTCEDSVIYSIVTKYSCSNGDIVDSAGDCVGGGGGGNNIQVKQCSPKNYVSLGDTCNSGIVLYDDDVDGDSVCVQGVKLEDEVFYLPTSGTRHQAIRKNRIVLMGVNLISGRPVVDMTVAPLDYRILTQDVLDSMVYSQGGYYSIAGGNYKFATEFKVDPTSGQYSIYTDLNTGNPVFISDQDAEKLLPIDPVTEGLCSPIPSANLPPRKSFDIGYNHGGFYSNVKLLDVPTSSTASSWDSHFIDGVEDLFKTRVYPITMNVNNFFELGKPSSSGKDRRGNMPLPVGYDRHTMKDTGWYDDALNLYPVGGGSSKIETSANCMWNYLGCYAFDDNMSVEGCSSLTFELWGAGADSMVGGSSDMTNDFVAAKQALCTSHSGESGAYVKGKLNLRRGSRLFVMVAANSNIANIGDQASFASGHHGGTALWVAEPGQSFKLVALARNGDPRSPLENFPETNGQDKFISPSQFAPYKNILDPNFFGYTTCGSSTDGGMPDVIQRKDNNYQIDKNRASLLEMRRRQISSFCGGTDAVPMTCPVSMVDSSGNETSAKVRANLDTTNDPTSDINRIGTWPFMAMIRRQGGDSCKQLASFAGNSNSYQCLQYSMKAKCNIKSTSDSDSKRYQVPSDWCRGLGGGYSNTPTRIYGSNGYARLTCK